MNQQRFYINEETSLIWCEDCFANNDSLGDYFTYGLIVHPHDSLTCSECDDMIFMVQTKDR